MRRIPTILALALLAGLFAANVYRARTQSFTTDEALTCLRFVKTPLRVAILDYDANNHVLNSLLARGAVALFGSSDFTLRLPSLLGGALYFAAVFLLARRLWGAGWMALLTVAVLALNPYLLDFLSVARGYGLALALLLWTFEFLFRWWDDPARPWLTLAAVSLALAVSANLTIAFPGLALAAIVAAIHIARRDFATAWDGFLVPGMLAAFVVLVLPLSGARLSSFYVGLPSFQQGYDTLIVSSLYYSTRLLPEPEGQASLLRFELRQVTLVLAPLATALAPAVVVWLAWRRRRFERCLVFFGGTLAGCVALLVVIHRYFGVLYPERRTGLYLIPLFTFTAFALLKLAASRKWLARIVVPAGAAYFALCAWIFARQWDTTFYLEWVFDSRTKDIVRILEDRHAAGPRPARVSAAGATSVTLNYYRDARRLDWLIILNRDFRNEPADYYVFAPDKFTAPGPAEVLLRDDLAGVALARVSAPPPL